MPAEQGKTGPRPSRRGPVFVAHWRGSRRRERGGSGSGNTIFPLFSGNVVWLHRRGRRTQTRQRRIPTGPAAFSVRKRSHRTAPTSKKRAQTRVKGLQCAHPLTPNGPDTRKSGHERSQGPSLHTNTHTERAWGRIGSEETGRDGSWRRFLTMNVIPLPQTPDRRPKTSLTAKKPRHERHNNGPTPGKSWKRGLMARKPHHEGDSPNPNPRPAPENEPHGEETSPRTARGDGANPRRRGKLSIPRRKQKTGTP
ncbi:hypothetical protein PSRA_1747 [Pseudoscardovia radai]|uniref:Uncharacterized protein n=1 Tax=Pseudoscardovia radai TaxID=987066 RepID=A0A261EPW7_9BIFI|nr:hypothetical protein PSRA_1747 [Pseudoscardovia radai]